MSRRKGARCGVSSDEVFAAQTLPIATTRVMRSAPAGVHCHEFLEIGFVAGGHATYVSEAGITVLRPRQQVDPQFYAAVVRVGASEAVLHTLTMSSD